jgi:hypothetical protein
MLSPFNQQSYQWKERTEKNLRIIENMKKLAAANLEKRKQVLLLLDEITPYLPHHLLTRVRKCILDGSC